MRSKLDTSYIHLTIKSYGKYSNGYTVTETTRKAEEMTDVLC